MVTSSVAERAYGAATRSVLAALERNLVPDAVTRRLTRLLLASRLRQGYLPSAPLQLRSLLEFVHSLGEMPIAIETDKAKSQHYELPTAFFKLVLGRNLKYSSCYFTDGSSTLEDAEVAMMQLYCERAKLQDGQSILDVGCGWGSLSLYIAKKYRNCSVTGICNSTTQKAFIEEQCRENELSNVEIIVADISKFEMERSFDRIISIEMFEHMKNYKSLLKKISTWMKEDSLLFVHLFCHKTFPYLFEDDRAYFDHEGHIAEEAHQQWMERDWMVAEDEGVECSEREWEDVTEVMQVEVVKMAGMEAVEVEMEEVEVKVVKDSNDDDWITRYFFSGGTMPSANLLLYFQEDVSVVNHWLISGTHYARTSEEWLKRMDKSITSIRPIFEKTYGKESATKWIAYWRTFFIAVAELFGYNNGDEWMVAHYLFRKK
ncbi:hypothetical protein U9M48_027204 [Paspalum notatum var. saurae]|uniref:Coclaurine N-methyltransferase n=1 Tax=Paspalum notatum var. saurae TaxID=547442 RepID=A0AAQ3WZ68_PASNO